MQKTLMALCITAALTAPVLAQQAAPSVTVYGIADVALVQVSNSGGARVRLVDSGRFQSSRLGFRGREDLGGGLTALFTLEHGISLDTGSASSATFWNRQALVGLSSSSFGTVTLGLQYTPIYDQLILQSPAPTFGGHAGALDGVALPTSPSAVARFDNTLGGSRVANSVKYTSPTFAGFKVRAMYAMGEVEGSSAAGQTVSLGIGYDKGPLTAGLLYLEGKCKAAAGCTAAQADNQLWVAGAGYDAGAFKINGIFSSQKDARNVKGNDADVMSVFTSVPLGSWVVAAGYSTMNDKSSRDWDVQQVNFSSLYYLSKRTSVYGVWSMQKVDNGGKAHMLLLTSSTDSQSQFGAGLRHSF